MVSLSEGRGRKNKGLFQGNKKRRNSVDLTLRKGRVINRLSKKDYSGELRNKDTRKRRIATGQKQRTRDQRSRGCRGISKASVGRTESI